MAIGNEIGKFSSTATSMTKGVDSAGNHTFVMNFEGTVSGAFDGTTLSTITAVSGDFKTGTFAGSVAAYLKGGDVVTGDGSGTIASVGEHKWQLDGFNLLSDGTRVATEGVLDLASRTLNGKIFAVA